MGHLSFVRLEIDCAKSEEEIEKVMKYLNHYFPGFIDNQYDIDEDNDGFVARYSGLLYNGHKIEQYLKDLKETMGEELEHLEFGIGCFCVDSMELEYF